ncbi:MAG TPA: hypothetical protein VGG98_06330 [Solirubrobacteraceae bacterium]
MASTLALPGAPALASPVHIYNSSFGGTGSEPGKFNGPTGVAVNEVTPGEVGDVYVADTGNERVERFAPEGKGLVGEFDGHETPTGSLASPTALAMDNSTNPLDPSRGDVYVLDAGHNVVDKFESDGKWAGTIKDGAGGEPLGGIDGVAVDPEGVVWVYQASGEIDSYSSAEANEFLSSRNSPFGASPGFAVDSQDNLYVTRGSGEVAKINSSGGILIEAMDAEVSTAAAVDQATREVYVDNTTTVAVFDAAEECTATTPCGSAPSASLGQRFGQGHIASGSGIAVDAATDLVYVADAGSDRVAIFGASVLPLIESESLATVEATDATVNAQINPHGTTTTYLVEYGTVSTYGLSTTKASAGDGFGPASEHIQLDGLQPGTTYHARVVATSEFGTSLGKDIVFTTPVATSAGLLPDRRGYELVSSNATSDGNVYVQQTNWNRVERLNLASESPIRAATNGEAVTYVAEAEPTGGAGSTGEGFGDEFKATRTATGWSTNDIMAPRQQTKEYQGFSSDLSVGALVMYVQPPLTADAPANCSVLYLRTVVDAAFHAEFTSTQTPGECGRPVYAGISDDDSHVIFESEAALTPQAHPTSFASEEYNLYESVAGDVHLVSVLPNGEPANDATFGVSKRFPGGTDTEPEGSDFDRVISPNGSRIVWTDLDTAPGPENPTGTTRLFVRENAESPSATTVQVDAAVGGGGQYRGASADDSLIYFTKDEKLYRYDLKTSTATDLTPGGGVVGVAGISEDGSEIYLVAGSVLATNSNGQGETPLSGSCERSTRTSRVEVGQTEINEEEAREGRPPSSRVCNLYVLRGGNAPHFIARLLPTDDSYNGPDGSGFSNASYGDWAGGLGYRLAEVSRDGGTLAFVSRRSLTGYDNNAVNEIYVYDANDEKLSCASCNPSGEPASQGDAQNGERENDPPVPQWITSSYQYRWVSANGNRVFFNSNEALVPQDINGHNDVYEWEHAGEGSCRRPAGCTYLISGNIGKGEAYFSDASENGDDVFFTSRADLVPEDEGENVVLYDARVGGGFSHVSQACTGTGCQGVPPAAPIFATPASETFSGIGNYPPSASTRSLKPKSAAALRAERLTKALKTCRAKHDKRKRVACERQARKRYGPPRKAKKATRRPKSASDERRTNS